MNRKFLPITLLVAVVAGHHASAQVVIGSPGGTPSNLTWTMGLNGSGVTTTTGGARTGTFTGGVANDSFVVTVNPFTGWNTATATTAVGSGGTAFTTYLGTLTASTIGTVNSSQWGVAGNTIETGEAAVFTFGSYSLNSNSRVRLNQFTLSLNTAVSDYADWVFYDSSANTFLFSGFDNNQPGNLLGGNLPITNVESGDILVLAGTSTRAGGWRINSTTFDLVTVPEPSTAATIALVMGALCLARRRRN